jgi:hypothetical protein
MANKTLPSFKSSTMSVTCRQCMVRVVRGAVRARRNFSKILGKVGGFLARVWQTDFDIWATDELLFAPPRKDLPLQRNPLVTR